jgi:phosphoribosyl 1,2-cyclic phosphodiesterase
VVPSFMKQKFIEKTGIDDDRLIEPVAGQMLHLHGLDVLPFHGQHFHTQPSAQGQPPVTLGVPSLGYQIRWRDRSWLFVGDTRTYDPAALLSMQGAEILFGHVWLGRESAHLEQPPLLDAFVAFLAALKPAKQIVLAHLYEVSRPPQDCWSEDHALKVKAGVQQHLPDVKVVWALSGQEIPL